MKDLATLSKLLKDRRLDAIQDKTGLSKPTIAAVRDQTADNYTYSTIEKLSKYFEDQEAEIEQLQNK